jgi:uncharacterized membrane protein
MERPENRQNVRAAKQPLSRVAGPYGHPIHPLLVTVPIGAFVCSLIFDVLTRTRAHGLPYLVDGAYWLIGVGLIGALIAAVFGVMDLLVIPRGTRAFHTGVAHMLLNATVLGLFLIGFTWRASDHLELDKVRWGQLALSAAAVSLLVVAAWLGGTLAYRFGVRVADDESQAEGFRRVRRDGTGGDAAGPARRLAP